jgi:hypothetical protein
MIITYSGTDFNDGVYVANTRLASSKVQLDAY